MRLNLIAIFAIFFAQLNANAADQKATQEEGTFDWIHLEPHRPIYFLIGNPYTKIEISFKTKLIEDTPLYLSYTQLMMWDLLIRDPYFEDINYNPEIFYQFRSIDIGVEHESNGRGDDSEVAWNRVYARYHRETKVGKNRKLGSSIKAWVPFWYERNSDIIRYRGLWELDLTLSSLLDDEADTADLTFRLYPGGEFYMNPALGGQELTFRAKIRAIKLFPLLVVQLFHGYAENLSDYRQERFALRAGFGF